MRNKGPFYGAEPVVLEAYQSLRFSEFMHYQYLPVRMPGIIMATYPPNLAFLDPLVAAAQNDYLSIDTGTRLNDAYVYVTARHGYATPDNPLNRPGWHCDGFGSNDINYIWWDGSGTQFAVQQFHDISDDHLVSLQQFEEQIDPQGITTYPPKHLYRLNPYVVHTTPDISPPGEMRSFVKISISPHRYNLQGNSHNHHIQYNWDMHPRDVLRNDPHAAQLDYVK